ncbi:MAG: hypothetical protein P8J69_00325 [Flavobacteriaceae bacterium]|nr:hypothetical protein [Flavobacteriaceae bacterium]
MLTEIKEIDMAVILSKGIIRGIIKNNKYKIVLVFIKIPFISRIQVATNSYYHTIDKLKGIKVAISRFESGSHSMALAYINNKTINRIKKKF